MSQPFHIFTATGLSWVHSEFSTEDRRWDEANGTHLWLEYQDSVTQQQHYIKLLSGCRVEEVCDWLGTRSRTEIWWFKNTDFFPQLLSIPAFSYLLLVICSKSSFPFSKKPPLCPGKQRFWKGAESHREATHHWSSWYRGWLQLSDILPTWGCEKHCY